MTRVIYKGAIYTTKLPVRDSLFEDLKRTNPKKILHLTSPFIQGFKVVFIEEVSLCRG